MVRIQKQLVVEQDIELGYGKVIQKRTVDGTVVDREYDKINAGSIPAKNPVGSETDIQTELDSKLDLVAGDLIYARLNGNETQRFKVANPIDDNESVPLVRLNTDLGSHTGNTANPHNVTKSQINLGNVDNTSDMDKPISSATQIALDDKAPLSHTQDLANPHQVTAAQVGADPDGSADAVQAHLDTHIADTDTHGLITTGDGSNYLSDDGTYKNIDPITVHNQLTGRDGNDTHPIESITGLRSELDGKATDGESYLKTEHVVASNGIEHAGKPIILDGAGQLDPSLMGQGLYFVAMYTPEASNEYPDATGENTGAFWGVEGVDPGTGYTFTGGDLQGATVYNGDMVVRGEQEWGYRSFGDAGSLFLRVDGSNSMAASLPMNNNKIVNMAPATTSGEAVEYSQISGLATAYLRLDGSTAMTGNLDIGGGVNKIVNLEELAVNPTDVPNYGQLTAHEDNISNPHQVTVTQVGAEPADPALQEHLVATDNPHSVTVTQINAEPADPAIQTHLSDISNPHSVTKDQVGLDSVDNTSDLNKPISTATQIALDTKENSLGLGTAGQVLVTNSAVDGKEWKSIRTGYKNLLINGDKRVNQRDFDGSSFVDGEYCWDRWKATATAMVQIVEEGNYIPDTEYTLSGDGVTTQQIISPASGHWTIPEVPRTATDIQLELGDTATNFEQRHIALERSLCERYYQTFIVYSGPVVGGTVLSFGGIYPTVMRTSPTLTQEHIGGSTTDWSIDFVDTVSLGLYIYEENWKKALIKLDAEIY